MNNMPLGSSDDSLRGNPKPPQKRSPGYGGSPASGSCGAIPPLPDPRGYGDPGDGVKAISRATSEFISQCGCDTRACIADALDRYAEALAAVAPRLAPRLRNLPSIVSTAARRVRKASTNAEAVRILTNAVATVRNEIELVRVDNPDAPREETRGGDFVAGTLEKAALALDRPDAL